MAARRWSLPLLLLLLVAAVGGGLYATRELPAPPPPSMAGERQEGVGAGGRAGAPAAGARGQERGGGSAAQATEPRARQRRQRPFDLQILLTARRVIGLAEQPEEVELAQQAMRIADHAVDLAFADTLQRIATEPPEQTPELRALAAEKARMQTEVEAATARVEALARAQGAGQAEGAGEHVEVARARLELLRDELEEVSEKLARAGGDPDARIQRLRAQYEAAQKVPAAEPAGPPPAARGTGSLRERLRTWLAQRAKVSAIEEARGEVLVRIQAMERWRDRVGKRIQEAEAAAVKAEGAGAAPAPTADGATPVATRAAAATATATADPQAERLRRLARDQRRLTSLGRRLQDHQELAEVYADWAAIAGTQARAGLHATLRRAVWVIVALALAWMAGLLVERTFRRRTAGDLRAGTLKGVVRIAVQGVALLVILFIVLGVPGQVTTILGLAGAGLTVALKDFIVAFFGWFVLMGRNGIRVGDWVEIKGVGGEVAEIGLIHTVLLETGSWSDAGHPTGRRVSFSNSFALEGHYFNFTTSGQWMWDALQVLVPLGQDPYPVIDGIQHLVERETEANGAQAEQEWKKTASRYRVQTFSAVPGINVVPTSTGVQLDVRYITRAHERHATRRRLYGAVVQLMHGKRDP